MLKIDIFDYPFKFKSKFPSMWNWASTEVIHLCKTSAAYVYDTSNQLILSL